MSFNKNYTVRDYEAFRKTLLTELKRKIPEYTDFSESDVGVVLMELLAHGFDVQSYYIDRVAKEVHLTTAKNRDNIIQSAKIYGYVPRSATASKLLQIFKITPQKKEFIIPKGFKVSTKETAVNPQIFFETTRALEIPQGKDGTEQDDLGNYIYAVPVVQGYTVDEEVLGTSQGTPDQKFRIKTKPILTDTVRVWVNEKGTFEEWDRVDSFLKSKPSDKHFVVDIMDNDYVQIAFGNGSTGKIPEALDQNLLVSYRVGGGDIGNVSIGLVTELVDNLADISETRNISTPVIYGEEKESNEDIKRNAIASLRTMKRCVTLQDYEDTAYFLPYVLKAYAEEVHNGRTINIHILAKNNDYLTEEQIEQANELYTERKMLGTFVELKNPEYIPLNIDVKYTPPQFSDINFEKEIRGVIEYYFSKGQFTFKQTFRKAHLISELMEIIPSLVDIDLECTNMPTLTNNQIIKLGDLSIVNVKQGGN